MFKGKVCKLGLSIAFFTLTPALVFAQFNSNVQGTVTDPSGAPIPHASVTLHNQQTGVDNAASTDDKGYYRFNDVVNGDYLVKVSASGFQSVDEPFTLHTQETAGINVALKIASASTSVTVTEQASGINPDETRLVTSVSGDTIADLPLPQRGTLQVLKLAPGAVETAPASIISNISIGSQQPSVTANGRPPSSNLYRMDGIPIMSAQSFGNINLIPTPDMVGETTLQTSTFNAEVGGTSSLVTDFTTKGGTNLFHGDIDGTYSSRYFSEHQWDTGAATPFTQKWLSGSLGGPIVKNHTFFFGSAETQVIQNSSGGLTGNIETDQFYNWAKTALPDSNFVNKYIAYRPTRVQFTQYTQYASQIFPTNGPIACGQASSDFMPCSLPVFGVGYFAQSPSLPGTQYNIRLDHYFHNDQDRIFLNYFRLDQTSQFLSPRPAFDSLTPSTTEFGAANYVHTFNASLVNQAQFGWTRYHFDFGAIGNNQWIDTPFIMMDIGWAGTDKAGFVGYFPPDIDPGGDNNKDHEYRFRDSLSWVKGNHSLRIGFDATHEDYWSDNSAEYARPFVVQYNSFWNLLNDNPYTYSLYTISAQTGKFIPQTFGAQVTQFGSYVQDEWKLRPNLTINWGLRWDDYGNPYNYGKNSQPYVNAFFSGADATRAELQQSLINTVGTKFVDHPFSGRMDKNFEPRLGLAWALGQDKKTVIRAGFGYYLDGLDLSGVTSNLPTQPPNRLTITTNAFDPNAVQPGKTPFGTSTAYPYGFNYPVVHPNGFDQRGAPLDTNGKVIQSDLNGIDPNLSPQKTGIWNFGVQRELPFRIVAEASYSGSYSWDQFYQPDWNTLPNHPNRLTNEWGKIKYLTNGFTSNYNALILTAHQQLGRLNWTSSYTWSHAMTDQFLGGSEDIATIVYGTSPYDVRQHFSLGGTYQLPSPHNLLLKEVAGGWTIGTVLVAQTGTPFTVVSATDSLNDGDSCQCSVPVITQPMQVSGFSRSQYVQGIFPTQTIGGQTVAVGFANPATGLNGTEGPNAFRNPGFLGLDASLVKRIVLPWFADKTSAFTLRVEAINALNHTNLQGVGSATFQTGAVTQNYGQVVSANPPRVIQLGARFEF